MISKVNLVALSSHGVYVEPLYCVLRWFAGFCMENDDVYLSNDK